MSPACTLTRRRSQPTCRGAIHPPPPGRCTLIPLSLLQASKASATWDTHTCAHIVRARTGNVSEERIPRHLLPPPAATPTSSHLFQARSFQQPVFCLPPVTRLPLWSRSGMITVRLASPRAEMPQQIYGGRPAPRANLGKKNCFSVGGSHWLHKKKCCTRVWLRQRDAMSTTKYSNTDRRVHRATDRFKHSGCLQQRQTQEA